MSAVTATLEISFDPLSTSNAEATWEDISGFLIGAEWSVGKGRDLDEPQAGTATFTLENADGRFTPTFEDGAYYPNIVPLRRLRLSLDDGTTTSAEGVWYVTDWGPVFGRQSYHEAEVTCVDGQGLLQMTHLVALDPPDASSYADVVTFDRPFGYWRLGDPPTATEAAAEVGNAGIYKSRSRLTLGAPGGILGDPDTAVTFSVSGSVEGHVEIPLSATENTLDGDSLTVEAWIKTTATNVCIASGPYSGAGTPVWMLTIGVNTPGSDTLAFTLETAPASVQATQTSTGANDGDWHHVVGTWITGQATLYLDGALVGSASGPSPLLSAAANPKVRIGSMAPADNFGFDGTIDEVAVYETTLSAARILAHYQAGAARGFPAELAGERVAATVASPLWDDSAIMAGHHTVAPTMKRGQLASDETLAAVKAETPTALLFWNGDGDPEYLPWNYRDGLGPQATFGDGDPTQEIPYESIGLAYADEFYNEVTVSRDGGLAQTVTDAASQAELGRRTYSITGLTHLEDNSCLEIAQAILDLHGSPELRVTSLELAGIIDDTRAQILTRQIGDLIRVKKRAHGTDPAIDVITHILGWTKTLQAGSGEIRATFNTSRGFSATPAVWRLGITGFTELDVSTVLA